MVVATTKEGNGSMDRRIIQDSIEYIESHLRTEITAQELSAGAGFSLFHYYRLFTQVTGMPIMQYITRRRLLHAVYEISLGMKKTDAVLLYGFDTYAGFYKAFLREFGCTPAFYLGNYPVTKPYKINILQEEPIMVSHRHITELLKTFWGIEDAAIKDVVYEGTGKINDSAYYVGDEYVLKFSTNLGKLKNHIAISEALEKEGLLAAVPVAACGGEKYVQDGQLFCCLTRRIQGRQFLPQKLFTQDGKKDARFIGEIVGHLSVSLAKIDIVVEEENMYESAVNWAIPLLQKKSVISGSICRRYIEEFGNLYERLPRQVIHRDPNPGNIITQGDRWGFIDFELSERAVRIFDPCYAATAILSEFYGEGDIFLQWIEVYKEIMQGYDSVVKLTEDEKNAVPYVVLTNQLLATAWFSEQDKYQDVYEVNKSMTKSVAEHFDMLKL